MVAVVAMMVVGGDVAADATLGLLHEEAAEEADREEDDGERNTAAGEVLLKLLSVL